MFPAQESQWSKILEEAISWRLPAAQKTLLPGFYQLCCHSLYLSTAWQLSQEEEKGRLCSLSEFRKYLLFLYLEESIKIHQGEREIIIGLICMAECFMENPMNSSWILGPILRRPRGIYSVRSTTCLSATPVLVPQRCSWDALIYVSEVVCSNFAQRNSFLWPRIPLQMCC